MSHPWGWFFVGSVQHSAQAHVSSVLCPVSKGQCASQCLPLSQAVVHLLHVMKNTWSNVSESHLGMVFRWQCPALSSSSRVQCPVSQCLPKMHTWTEGRGHIHSGQRAEGQIIMRTVRRNGCKISVAHHAAPCTRPLQTLRTTIGYMSCAGAHNVLLRVLRVPLHQPLHCRVVLGYQRVLGFRRLNCPSRLLNVV